MRHIHNAHVTVFINPEEYSGNDVLDKYKAVFHSILPLDFDKEKLNIVEEAVEGFENRKIKILSLDISKESHTKIFIKALKELIGSGQCKTILEQKWSRLDDELYFYIRLDKQAALKGMYELTDGGDCIHIRLHIAAFPKNRDAALKVVDEIFA